MCERHWWPDKCLCEAAPERRWAQLPHHTLRFNKMGVHEVSPCIVHAARALPHPPYRQQGAWLMWWPRRWSRGVWKGCWCASMRTSHSPSTQFSTHLHTPYQSHPCRLIWCYGQHELQLLKERQRQQQQHQSAAAAVAPAAAEPATAVAEELHWARLFWLPHGQLGRRARSEAVASNPY